MHHNLLVAALTSALAMASAIAAEPTQQPETQRPATTSDATSAQPTAPSATAPAPGSLDEVLCEIRKEPYTGTHISYRRKVCKTRREWEEEKRIADRVLEKVVKGGDRKNPQGN